MVFCRGIVPRLCQEVLLQAWSCIGRRPSPSTGLPRMSQRSHIQGSVSLLPVKVFVRLHNKSFIITALPRKSQRFHIQGSVSSLPVKVFSRVHATLYITMSVGLSVCLSVGPKSLLIFGRLELKGKQISVTAPAQLPYCPCPPTRDWCCRVYGLVQIWQKWLLHARGF